MKKQTQAMAVCGVMAAMNVVLMLLGAALEIGIYAAPMFAGLCLLPVRQRFGVRYQIMVWLMVSFLNLLLVPNVEQNLLYLTLFGCYPVIGPLFQRIPRGLRAVAKAVWFNGVTVSVELLVIRVLAPEVMEIGFVLLLLAMANIVFWCFDFVLPRIEYRLIGLMRRILPE